MRQVMDADIEEIIDTTNRSWAMGYLLAGKEATLKRLTTIEPPKKNPADYDLVMIWTPVRAFTMASAIRTYITDFWKSFPAKIAFFCTQAGSGHERTFRHMEDLSQKKPAAVADFLTKEIVSDTYKEKMESFLKAIV